MEGQEGTGRDESEGQEDRRGTRGRKGGEGRRRTYFITAFRIHVGYGVFCPERGLSQ